MNLETKTEQHHRLSPEATRSGFTAALAGLAAGLIAIGFAVCLFAIRLPWLGGGALCYALAMLWMGWLLARSTERAAQSAERLDDDEETRS